MVMTMKMCACGVLLLSLVRAGVHSLMSQGTTRVMPRPPPTMSRGFARPARSRHRNCSRGEGSAPFAARAEEGAETCPVLLPQHPPVLARAQTLRTHTRSHTRPQKQSMQLTRLREQTQATQTRTRSQSQKQIHRQEQIHRQNQKQKQRQRQRQRQRQGELDAGREALAESGVRIVGGSEASADLARYVAFIESASGGSCTGALLSARVVATAAHCDVTTNSIVTIGAVDVSNNVSAFASSASMSSISRASRSSSFLSRVGVDSFTMHPDHANSPAVSGGHDIAFITLNESVSSEARFMLLNVNPSIPLVASVVRAAGYGRVALNDTTALRKLHQVDLQVTSGTFCASSYSTFDEHLDFSLVICARSVGGVDCSPCKVDSGGPLFQYNADGTPVLVGVISRGKNCSTAEQPAIFVRVSADYSLFPAGEVTLANETEAYTVSDDGGTISTAPSPSYTPLPKATSAAAEDGAADDAGSQGQDEINDNSSPSLTTIVIASVSALLAVGAVIAVLFALFRK